MTIDPTGDRTPAVSDALERIRDDVEARELGPVDQIEILDEVDALWFLLDYDEPAITASLLGWVEWIDVVDATAGRYSEHDVFLRLNVRGLVGDWPVVITLPAHYGTQPERVALIQQQISDRDPVLLVTHLLEQDIAATYSKGL